MNLLVDFLRNFVAVFEEEVADFCRDGEARRHGHAGLAHFGESRAFAAEDVFHLAVAVGRASAKRVNVFLHFESLSPDFGIRVKLSGA